MQLYKRTAIYTLLATAAWTFAVYAKCVTESGVNTRQCIFDPYTYECYKKGTTYYICCESKADCENYQWV
ncbi:uncharacterized protein PgNI_12154 [Pyricularia grisea]|uniref:Uncharacterized protein n=1 Tax=Pyricularia grisea TaxID=148305 RepID=A0A6P8AQ99_PYRGI|nr:uncharacterized protein PgNI_12154 [Pyricularia grisea]TLD04232.1 hypothetical protein PgNI_12154 [Pyricularia grisea]